MTISLLGWAATAVFAGSYFFRQAGTLKKLQAAAACLSIIYGVAMGPFQRSLQISSQGPPRCTRRFGDVPSGKMNGPRE